MKISRTRAAWILGVAIALCAIAFGAWRAVGGPALDAYAVERGEIVQSVVASGRVESPRRVEIASAITASVVSVPVAEGQAVAAGQLLVALDAQETRAARDQARFALAQAEAKLAQLQATALPLASEAARQAEVNLANAERALERSRELFARGFVGQAALDEAQRGRDVADSVAAAARLNRASQSAGGSDVRLAEAAADAARASLRVAEARLALTTLAAPVAGVLISRNVEAGNVAQPGRALMVLSPSGATELVVQIDEKNLQLLRVGQAALASADAYAQQRFAATVAYINPAVDPLRGSVEVKLAVSEPPAYLLQDMTVSVDIEVARHPGALSIPPDALREGDWVLAARDGKAVRQQVRVGARGTGRVEILSGLREGELVLAGPGAALREGRSVRATLAARGNGKRS